MTGAPEILNVNVNLSTASKRCCKERKHCRLRGQRGKSIAEDERPPRKGGGAIENIASGGKVGL